MKTQMINLTCLLILISFFSCRPETVPPQTEPQWKQILVPHAGAIYSMNGNLKEELIVGGNGEIRKTTNQGIDWSIVQDNLTAYEFQMRQDTLIAIGLNNYYSLNNGDTWLPYTTTFVWAERPQILHTSDGTLFKIERSSTYPAQPDKILTSTDGGDSWIDIFPFKRKIYSMYLDANEQVYIGASGWEWDDNQQSFDSNAGNNHGIIYLLEKEN